MDRIIIKNGLVLDGTGAAGFPADVAVEGDRIVAVGQLESVDAEITIDASERVVAPGFIDMHSHADYTLPVWPTADSLLHQGITTVVVGQCGFSPAPLREATRESVVRQVAALLGGVGPPLPWDQWSNFGEYLGYLEQIGISPNVVPLVGQGVVRAAVMGYTAGPASAEQMRRMQTEVVRAMEEGAFGLSTGLIYPPGSFAAFEEPLTARWAQEEAFTSATFGAKAIRCDRRSPRPSRSAAGRVRRCRSAISRRRAKEIGARPDAPWS
ncbi:MAG: amidohydrolase family protein [Desulfobacterales bacterium]|nr:MAG: amidohydrolase family protein [Desulfobacterales bacterium]